MACVTLAVRWIGSLADQTYILFRHEGKLSIHNREKQFFFVKTMGPQRWMQGYDRTMLEFRLFA